MSFVETINISTHTPLAGRDHFQLYFLPQQLGFLLTRPLRDVTIIEANDYHIIGFLLTRPLRDVTAKISQHASLKQISTHTPLAGRDQSASTT